MENIEIDPTDVAKVDIRRFHEEKLCNDSILLSPGISSTRILTLQLIKVSYTAHRVSD